MKYFLSLLSIFVLLLNTSGETKAQDTFDIDLATEYDVQEDAKTYITHTITIVNKTSEFYPKSFTLTLLGANPQNIKAYEGGEKLNIFKDTKTNEVKLRVEFQRKTAGLNSQKIFTLSYIDDTYARKTGETLEIRIPKVLESQNFREYRIRLLVPEKFGVESHISPIPDEIKKENGKTLYKFEKEEVKNKGIVLNFGEYQTFDFALNYHLQNDSLKNKVLKIAIPPDTSFQKVYYRQITPEPLNAETDEDGNWLVLFSLGPKQKLNVSVKGSVQVFLKPIKDFKNLKFSLSDYTKPTYYWQSDDKDIKNIASQLKDIKDIYYYVTDYLAYDYNRIFSNFERFGAKKALKNPKNALCSEFTDTFIALARAKGIPAREINGYAYTDNPILRPFSLNSDVLHSWPEYWEESRQNWIPVDPTWESTSNSDFFNKFDLNHITFVIHGRDPENPKVAGFYKEDLTQKGDIYVDVGEVPTERVPNLEISLKKSFSIPFFKQKYLVTIKNKGPLALYSLDNHILLDSKTYSFFQIPTLLPYEKYEKEINLKTNFLALDLPKKILVKSFKNTVEFQVPKNEIIIKNLTILFLFLTSTLLLLYLKIFRKDFFKFLRDVQFFKGN